MEIYAKELAVAAGVDNVKIFSFHFAQVYEILC